MQFKSFAIELGGFFRTAIHFGLAQHLHKSQLLVRRLQTLLLPQPSTLPVAEFGTISKVILASWTERCGTLV
jgi:hypothetical protein